MELAFVFAHSSLWLIRERVHLCSHCVCSRITCASLEICVVSGCLLYNMLWEGRESSRFWCVKCWCWFIGLATCKIYEYSSIRYNRLSPFPMWGSWELFRHLACAYPTSRSDWGATMSRKAHSRWNLTRWSLACLQSRLESILPCWRAVSMRAHHVSRNCCYCLMMLSIDCLDECLIECPIY